MITRNENGEVEFRFHHPTARHVYVVGNFNDWDIRATPMSRLTGGDWFAKLALPDGVYTYRFLADGNYYNDDAAMGVEEVPFECNSILVLNQSAEPALPVG